MIYIIVDTEGDIELWAFKSKESAQKFWDKCEFDPKRYKLFSVKIQA